jgi:sensor histidine kinase regulating citrate/malate metabolism
MYFGTHEFEKHTVKYGMRTVHEVTLCFFLMKIKVKKQRSYSLVSMVNLLINWYPVFSSVYIAGNVYYFRLQTDT